MAWQRALAEAREMLVLLKSLLNKWRGSQLEKQLGEVGCPLQLWLSTTARKLDNFSEISIVMVMFMYFTAMVA